MKEKHKKIIDDYKNIVEKISVIKEKRNKILLSHFSEVTKPIIIKKKDLESRIADIIPREPIHPTVFIASTIGFTKSNWNRTVEKILADLGFSTKLKYCSYTNMKQYEKLKLLILKYIDKKYKK